MTVFTTIEIRGPHELPGMRVGVTVFASIVRKTILPDVLLNRVTFVAGNTGVLADKTIAGSLMFGYRKGRGLEPFFVMARSTLPPVRPRPELSIMRIVFFMAVSASCVRDRLLEIGAFMALRARDILMFAKQRKLGT